MPASFVFNENFSGGVVASGEALVDLIPNETTGVLVGGTSTVQSGYGISGGSVTGGSSDLQLEYNSSGEAGPILSGTSSVSVVSDSLSSGGATLSGTSDVAEFYYSPDGAVVVGGSASIEAGAFFNGGAFLGGEASTTFVDFYNPLGGATASGISDVTIRKSLDFTSDGDSLQVAGSALAGVNPKYNTSGGIKISGSATARFDFDVQATFLWRIKGYVKRDLDFLWNLGRLPIFWYRVVGKQKSGEQCNLITNPCCQQFVVNVHARSLSELCDKLRDRKFILPIRSVQRFSTPAENAEVRRREALGEDFNCNELTPVEICNIPACAEFCVDYDLRVEAEFDIVRIQFNAFEHYQADGGVSISGSANYELDLDLPQMFHSSSGGVTVDGGSEVTSTAFSYFPDSGVEVSGTSDRTASSWTYEGGLWPSVQQNLTAAESSSLEQESSDQSWSLTERVLNDDGLYSSVDISFGKTSEFLIAKNFGIEVPEDATILSLEVTLQRLTTQSSVQDYEVYLVKGDEVISDNLAKTGVDWPFIETSTTYETDSLSPVDLNSEDFGFAIRVRANNSLPITIAKVDFVKLGIAYEDANHQLVRISGNSSVVSSSWSYTPDVQDAVVVIEGSIETPIVGVTYIGSGEISVTGTASIISREISSGGVVFGGEAIEDYQKLNYFGEGGSTLGGEASVIPYYLSFEGGVVFGGEALVGGSSNLSSEGGISLGGSAAQTYLEYQSSGGVDMSGSAKVISSVWKFFPEGGIEILGEAGLRSTDYGVLANETELQFEIQDFEVQFDSDVEDNETGILAQNINRCGCTTLPLKINFEHNIAKDNNFAKFLVRNSLTIDRRLEMFYNVTNDSWQKNLHYRGFSPNADSEETWDIVFELQCTSITGAIEIGRDIWKLGIEVFRRNLKTGFDSDTRILLGIYKEPLCDTSSNELNFKVNYNTDVDVAVVSPEATLYQSLIFDNIGLFKSSAWKSSPELLLRVSQVGIDIDQQRVDLTESVLG